jgi:hypothetical protein
MSNSTAANELPSAAAVHAGVDAVVKCMQVSALAGVAAALTIEQSENARGGNGGSNTDTFGALAICAKAAFGVESIRRINHVMCSQYTQQKSLWAAFTAANGALKPGASAQTSGARATGLVDGGVSILVIMNAEELPEHTARALLDILQGSPVPLVESDDGRHASHSQPSIRPHVASWWSAVTATASNDSSNDSSNGTSNSDGESSNAAPPQLSQVPTLHREAGLLGSVTQMLRRGLVVLLCSSSGNTTTNSTSTAIAQACLMAVRIPHTFPEVIVAAAGTDGVRDVLASIASSHSSSSSSSSSTSSSSAAALHVPASPQPRVQLFGPESPTSSLLYADSQSAFTHSSSINSNNVASPDVAPPLGAPAASTPAPPTATTSATSAATTTAAAAPSAGTGLVYGASATEGRRLSPFESGLLRHTHAHARASFTAAVTAAEEALVRCKQVSLKSLDLPATVSASQQADGSNSKPLLWHYASGGSNPSLPLFAPPSSRGSCAPSALDSVHVNDAVFLRAVDLAAALRAEHDLVPSFSSASFNLAPNRVRRHRRVLAALRALSSDSVATHIISCWDICARMQTAESSDSFGNDAGQGAGGDARTGPRQPKAQGAGTGLAAASASAAATDKPRDSQVSRVLFGVAPSYDALGQLPKLGRSNEEDEHATTRATATSTGSGAGSGSGSGAGQGSGQAAPHPSSFAAESATAAADVSDRTLYLARTLALIDARPYATVDDVSLAFAAVAML